MGSGAAERETGYKLDEVAYGHSTTRLRGWYKAELQPESVETGRFAITATPVTNRQYAAFVEATGHAVPDVDAQTWAAYKLIHPYERTRRHAWQNTCTPYTLLMSVKASALYPSFLAARTSSST